MEKNINKKIAGASLVEIMITMFLIALLLLAMVAVFPRMTKYSKQIHEGDAAKLIAAQIFDGLQGPAMPSCEGVGITADFDIPDNFKNEFQSTTIDGVIYKVDWAEFQLSLNCPTTGDLKTATITVNWNKDGKDHNVNVTGIIK
jgi:Tfp pilus assembly protein PilV